MGRTRFKLSSLLLASQFAAMAMVAGCGGSGGSSGATTTGGTTGPSAVKDLSPITSAIAANDSGAIIGNLSNGVTAVGVLRTPAGASISLKGASGTTNTYASGLNNSNTVVGSYVDSSSNLVAAAWLNGAATATALNSPALPQATGLTYTATAINNAGEIVGYRQYSGPGINEVQQVAITGSPTNGSFTLAFRYSGNETTSLPYASTAAQVQTALDTRPDIGAGGVTCTGGPLPATPITVTFVGPFVDAQTQPLLIVNSSLTGGTSPKVVVTEKTKGAAGANVTDPLIWSAFSAAPTALPVQGLMLDSVAGSYAAGNTFVEVLATNVYAIKVYRVLGSTPTTVDSFNLSLGNIVLYYPPVVNSTGSVIYMDGNTNAQIVTVSGTKAQISADSIPFGINTPGDVVGVLHATVAGGHKAFAYSKAKGVVDLNTLIAADSGWVLTDARAINDTGLVAGNGTYKGVDGSFMLQLPKGYY